MKISCSRYGFNTILNTKTSNNEKKITNYFFIGANEANAAEYIIYPFIP